MRIKAAGCIWSHETAKPFQRSMHPPFLSYNLRSVYKVRDRALAKLDAMIESGCVEIRQSRALEGKPSI